jgi:hypothetical protein
MREEEDLHVYYTSYGAIRLLINRDVSVCFLFLFIGVYRIFEMKNPHY